MENTWRYRVVEDNNFSIPKRLKEINPSYAVLLNKTNGKFEIHDESKKNTYCLTIGDELDGRAIDMINKQNQQDNDTMIREVDEHNAKIDRANEAKAIDDIGEISKDVYKFAQYGEIERKVDYKGGTF